MTDVGDVTDASLDFDLSFTFKASKIAQRDSRPRRPASHDVTFPADRLSRDQTEASVRVALCVCVCACVCVFVCVCPDGCVCVSPAGWPLPFPPSPLWPLPSPWRLDGRTARTKLCCSRPSRSFEWTARGEAPPPRTHRWACLSATSVQRESDSEPLLHVVQAHRDVTGQRTRPATRGISAARRRAACDGVETRPPSSPAAGVTLSAAFTESECGASLKFSIGTRSLFSVLGLCRSRLAHKADQTAKRWLYGGKRLRRRRRLESGGNHAVVRRPLAQRFYSQTQNTGHRRTPQCYHTSATPSSADTLRWKRRGCSSPAGATPRWVRPVAKEPNAHRLHDIPHSKNTVTTL